MFLNLLAIILFGLPVLMPNAWLLIDHLMDRLLAKNDAE